MSKYGKQSLLGMLLSMATMLVAGYLHLECLLMGAALMFVFEALLFYVNEVMELK